MCQSLPNKFVKKQVGLSYLSSVISLSNLSNPSYLSNVK